MGTSDSTGELRRLTVSRISWHMARYPKVWGWIISAVQDYALGQIISNQPPGKKISTAATAWAGVISAKQSAAVVTRSMSKTPTISDLRNGGGNACHARP
jgi:hypothetical protein